jgi:hypothetical protein
MFRRFEELAGAGAGGPGAPPRDGLWLAQPSLAYGSKVTPRRAGDSPARLFRMAAHFDSSQRRILRPRRITHAHRFMQFPRLLCILRVQIDHVLLANQPALKLAYTSFVENNACVFRYVREPPRAAHLAEGWASGKQNPDARYAAPFFTARACISACRRASDEGRVVCAFPFRADKLAALQDSPDYTGGARLRRMTRSRAA